MSEPLDGAPQGVMAKALENMPWWVQAFLFVAMTFGVPTVILLFHYAQEAGYVNNPVAVRLEQIDGSLEEMKGLSLRHEQTTREMVGVMEADAQRRQKRCVLRATTARDKEACFN